MITFDDDKQQKQLADIRRGEEEDVVQILAASKYNIPYANLTTTLVENEALRYIPETKARALEIAPFKILGKTLNVGVRAPEKPELADLAQELKQRDITVKFFMVSRASLEKVWERYHELSFSATSRVGGIDISGETIIETGKNIHSIFDIQKELEGVMNEKGAHVISRLLEIVLAGSISLNVSDVHIEPEENFVRIRLRLDGVLQDVFHLRPETYKQINSRLKLVSGMKLTSNDLAQDGRFSIFLGEDEISMRVSVVPGAYGEGIVMRILNPKSIRVDLEKMGIDPKVYDVMMRAIHSPNGLILITGPTGSGKTTTLYAFLAKIYSDELKFMTIEDPVEYHLPGITQTQVDHEKGYTFASGLRAALRQDPEVIMVGEIRDKETAETAIEASNTGHRVFSTLHTNSAAGVIPRLIDLGVNPKILVSALKLSLAQRLCRKLCEKCKKLSAPDEKKEKLLREVLIHAQEVGKDIASYRLSPTMPMQLYDAVGCTECNNTGYRGRIGIFEAIQTTEDIEKLIVQVPSEREVKKVAEKQGLLNLKEDGVVKMLRGITSYDEVADVVDLYEE